jgi:hypothetical protein
MWLALLAVAVASVAGAAPRCKKAVSIFPNKTDGCGNNEHCYDCLQAPGCGWCGGSHCDTTAEGCFPVALRSKGRHGEGPICSSAEGDQWITEGRLCDDCEQYTSDGCRRCLSASVTLNRPNVSCGWCKQSRGDVGSCRRGIVGATGPLYAPCDGEWRVSSDGRADEGQCDDYVKCSDQSSCLLCLTSFAGLGAPCAWCRNRGCLDARSDNLTCATPLLLHSQSPLAVCPTDQTVPPMHPNMRMHRNFNLVSSAVALGICLLLYFVHQLFL